MFRQLTLILCLFLVQLGTVPRPTFGQTSRPETKKLQKPQSWAALPPGKWPQLVLTSEAVFTGHSSLNGASAFLMRMSDGQVIVATAKHLIGSDGGVEPEVSVARFDDVLKSWHVFPRATPEAKVEASGLVMTRQKATSHDWLLLKLADPNATLPATPLRPRTHRASIGDTAYLVGVPYSDKKSSQNVYKGKVTARPRANHFTFEFDPPIKLAGFSGAPVVDEDGYVLGMLVGSKDSKREDGRQTECWCQDVSLGYAQWKRRNDPLPADPASAIRLKLPAGWTEESSNATYVVKAAEYSDLDASIQLQVIPKAKAKEGMDLKRWANVVKGAKVGASRLEELNETELTSVTIGGHSALEYQVSGKVSGIELRYRVILFERKDCFCNLMCWTFGENWSKAQPRFDEVFKAIE